MISIYTKSCENPDCQVVTFTHASCEPPICPGCNICHDCGYSNESHCGGDCPESCDECARFDECPVLNIRDNREMFDYCDEFERKDVDWGNLPDNWR